MEPLNISVTQTVIWAEEAMRYFDEEVKGIASDFAWYELLENVESYLKGEMTYEEFLPYMEMVFNIDDAAWKTINNAAIKRWEHVRDINDANT